MSKFHRRYTDEDLISIIKEVKDEIGRVPNYSDFTNRIPNASTYRRFGSWSNVLKLAGLQKEKQKSSDYTKIELINLLKSYYKKYNKVPTTRDLKKTEGYPTDTPFRTIFGSYKQALIESGLFEFSKNKDKNLFERKPYLKSELLNLLDDYIIKKGRIPSFTEIDKARELPSRSAYTTHFGSIQTSKMKFI